MDHPPGRTALSRPGCAPGCGSRHATSASWKADCGRHHVPAPARRDPQAAPARFVGDHAAVLIGVPPESRAGETRVAATPTTVGQLLALGYDVVIASGA